jgi:hypothetical protein
MAQIVRTAALSKHGVKRKAYQGSSPLRNRCKYNRTVLFAVLLRKRAASYFLEGWSEKTDHSSVSPEVAASETSPG